ncbi:putative Polysaccharide deacetylase [Candidatus Sulfobium mesophilum]|uniref:Putative Polysaccharide deacetylase n=1 Tax=Candidatus Sulfobium mesophilum TaxID=2016548 RepID=A0A2U3QEQ1_9BACT|nr:putative Polysaccharide deacetylase [Candidatus Sulfobium mesophilum]
MRKLAFYAWLYVESELRKTKNRILNLIDPPVVVLAYHRVSVPQIDFHSLVVSPENFRAQMEFLKRNFHLVRFEEDWAAAKKPAVAVTFDDGYADNVLALAIVEEVGVPVTFFISTGNIDSSNEFWWDELERLVLGEASYPPHFQLNDAKYGKTWSTETYRERRRMYWDLHQSAKKITVVRRTGWLRQIREWAGLNEVTDGANRSLTHDELMILAKSQWVTIGAHTISHPTLSSLTEEEQRHEVVSSKRQLEKLTGREITVFSYPFGAKRDYDLTTSRICREAGFNKAAAAFPGEAHRWGDPYQIPRHAIPNWDVDTFAAKLKGLWIR